MERNEAAAFGLTKYNTGRPCRHGHAADRYVLSGSCSACINGFSKSKRLSAFEEIAQKTKLIYLFSQESGYAALLSILDDLARRKFPNISPEAINPRPLKGKRVSRLTYQILVRVPVENIEEMYAIGRLLLEPEK